MKRGVIFCNGRKPTKARVEKFLKSGDTIICANGGTKHAFALGLVPHIVIGDLDSLPKKLRVWLREMKAIIIPHPKDKDFTDSELALEYTIAKGFKEVLLFGFTGSRLDHSLANILSLAAFHRGGITLRIIEQREEIDIVTRSITIQGNKGDRVSLIPLMGDAKTVTTTGLQWELTEEDLVFGKTRGVSNRLSSPSSTISLSGGILLVVHQGKTNG